MFRLRGTVFLICGVLIAACTLGTEKITAPTPTTGVTSTEAETAIPDQAGINLPTDRGKYFTGSGVCAACHTNMVDENGTDVSNDTYWRSTMMANAARDPYWQASVRKEVLANPGYQSEIEDKCATCHTPMARFPASQEGEKGKVLGAGFLNPDNEKHPLAMDGISCSVCHQIQETSLGQTESFSGHFQIDTRRAMGERQLFGPYPVNKTLVPVMQGGSGFIPTQGPQLKRSELCATCHTLYTPTIDVSSGEIVGEFPEQTPYLEWSNSDYRETQTCQDCHMPKAEGGVVLSITGGEPRSPFSRHVFVGGNAYMLKILKTFGDELQVTASDEQFDATIERTLDQLKNRTASLGVEAERSGSALSINVAIKNQAGHKFPSGYPSRRAWLHLTVRDQGGQIVFESGAFEQDGSIVGNDNDVKPDAYEPHYTTIDRPDQVQIYEAIIGDTQNNVTTVLMYGAGYLKDNRLLPNGFEKVASPEDVAVLGQAIQDEDFSGGGDEIRYLVDVSGAEGPFSITVELLYQSIGYRWAENLREYQAMEIDRFLDFYDSTPNEPILIASQTLEVGE